MSDGATMIVPGSTLPAGPALTATTPTLRRDGPVAKDALGSVISWRRHEGDAGAGPHAGPGRDRHRHERVLAAERHLAGRLLLDDPLAGRLELARGVEVLAQPGRRDDPADGIDRRGVRVGPDGELDRTDRHGDRGHRDGRLGQEEVAPDDEDQRHDGEHAERDRQSAGQATPDRGGRHDRDRCGARACPGLGRRCDAGGGRQWRSGVPCRVQVGAELLRPSRGTSRGIAGRAERGRGTVRGGRPGTRRGPAAHRRRARSRASGSAESRGEPAPPAAAPAAAPVAVAAAAAVAARLRDRALVGAGGSATTGPAAAALGSFSGGPATGAIAASYSATEANTGSPADAASARAAASAATIDRRRLRRAPRGRAAGS